MSTSHEISRQHTAKVMSETIDELESEFEHKGAQWYSDTKLAANKFRELMSALDVEESTQELALAILKEEGMHAVQVKVRACLIFVCFSYSRRPSKRRVCVRPILPPYAGHPHFSTYYLS